MKRFWFILLSCILVFTLASCGGTEQPSETSAPAETTAATKATTAATTEATTGSSDVVLSDPPDALLEEYFHSFYRSYDICAVEKTDNAFFYFSKITNDSEDNDTSPYFRVDRYNRTTGIFSGAEIPNGFTKWHIFGSAAVRVLSLPGYAYQEPINTFPQLTEIVFEKNIVYVNKMDYLSPLEEDEYCLYTAEDYSEVDYPDDYFNNLLTDITGTYDGICLFSTRPIGMIGAGDGRVRNGVTLDYNADKNTLTLFFCRIDANINELKQMGSHCKNVFVKSVDVEPYKAGFAITINLTDYVKSYSIAEKLVYSPENEPDGQTDATYIDVRFSRESGGINN